MGTYATKKRACGCLREEQYNLLSKHKMLLLLTLAGLYKPFRGIPIFQCGQFQSAFVMLAFER